MNFTTSDKIPYCLKQNKRTLYAPGHNSVCNNTVEYNKLVTGGNNPTISKAMRYSVYVRTQKSKTTVL